MKNSVICFKCSEENDHFNLNCSRCRAYLRDRVYNIDFWKMLSLLIESPIKAFRLIIYAEHKNFVIIMLFLLCVKIAFLSLILSNYVEKIIRVSNFQLHLLVLFLSVFGFIFFYSIILKELLKINGINSRFKDNLSILVYSGFPIILSLILSFVQVALFGDNVFSANPAPFLIKPLPAYILSFLEAMFFFWHMFLIITAVYAQSKSKLFATIAGIFFSIGILLIITFI